MWRSPFSKSLWDQRGSLLAWSVGLAALTAVYASLFPTIRNPQLTAAMEGIPAPLRSAMGIQNIGSPAGFLQSSVFSLLVPLLVIMFSASYGTRSTAGEEESGALELMLAHPVSRTSLLLERAAAMVLATAWAGGVVLAVLIALKNPAELDVPNSRLAAMVLHLVLLGICFGALALSVGAAFGKRGAAMGTAVILAVFGYFANTFGPQIENFTWTQKISLFYYYDDGDPLRNGVQPGAIVLAVVAVALIMAGLLMFNRRDIHS